MVDESICDQFLDTLEPADRELIQTFLECGEDAGDGVGGEGGESYLDLKTRLVTKDAYGDVVDQCDKAAQIIYEGCCDSGHYSGDECAAIAAQFFDHCCTVFQP